MLLFLFGAICAKYLFDIASLRDTTIQQIQTQNQFWRVNFWVKITEDFTGEIVVFKITQLVDYRIKITNLSGSYFVFSESTKIKAPLIVDLAARDMLELKRFQDSPWNFVSIAFTSQLQVHTAVENHLAQNNQSVNSALTLQDLMTLSFVKNSSGPNIILQSGNFNLNQAYVLNKTSTDSNLFRALYDFFLYNQNNEVFFNLAHRTLYHSISFQNKLWGMQQFTKDNEFAVMKGQLNYPKMRLSTAFDALQVSLTFKVRILVYTWSLVPSYKVVFYRREFANSTYFSESDFEVVSGTDFYNCVNSSTNVKTMTKSFTQFSKNTLNLKLLENNIKVMISFFNDVTVKDERI